MKELKVFYISLIFVLFFTSNYVFASMADYTDEDAERNTQKMIQEHKENFDSTKSENNYLKQLIVNGGRISPDFDRQVIDYSVKIENNINEIEISAIPEDNRATVKGIGKINISNSSECRIDVIAESGTTRTYFLKVVKENESSENIDTKSNNELNENNSYTDEIGIVNKNYNIIKENENAKEINNNNTKKFVLIGIGIGVLLCIFTFLIKSKNKK